MSRLFGTDGVRGLANETLTVELSVQLAQAASPVLGAEAFDAGRRPVAVVARDPRISGEFIAAAVQAGLASSGVDVWDAGVLPTPAAAYLVGDLDADFGVMISASHNPAPDNGIKFLARGGEKLTDAQEDEIIRHLEGVTPRRPQGADVGRVRVFADAEDRYVLHLLQTLPHRLDGLKVVLDCAHGAAAGCSPEAFRAAGAEVVVIGASPDGLNINDGYGSTHLEKLQAAVREHGADLGIAHDGDADRCLAVDERGEVVDGDQIMGVMAVALKDRGVLRDDTLVVTVMSNLGLKLAMGREGVRLVETQVGDRYVLAGMKLGDYSLGGEQSGHVIFSDHATTGDGVLTGLQLASRVAETGTPLSELAAVMDRLPQVLVNVRGVDKSRAAEDEAVQAAVAEAEARLGETGRVLLRPSGTEPVVRVMVEAPDEETAGREAQVLADVVQRELRLHD
ncbi:phosphoglucosamine mutase [Micrococcus luteus]|uniref:phosphoglucosamine mutase n=1 Tax=Micrococcus luteus TaxID=1270 RepID=UPI002A690546|nr:phosphoglucosamine mutase [Micrococcus luteus]MCV7553400.1 phosphoglucosamine mutase [Micrococcus luteus]MCV7662312.1 phosphoglucosamine mutase [Micrococcus luteus]